MELVIMLLTVLGLSVIELWAAIPAGLALQLHPLLVGATAALGASLGALLIVVLGGRLRSFLLRRHGAKAEKGRHGLIHRIWLRYGVIGLGLLAPLLTGAPLGAALGLSLGAPSGRLMLWICIGTILWSAGLTAVAALGLSGIEMLGH
jgi:membrane protein YqaA with SNARE-associated domain